MKEKTKNIKIFSKGFTLIEALVAIAILSLSILAAFTAIQGNLQKVNVTQNKVVSYYLAGEAIEFIRNLRDENAIANFRSIETGGSAVGWLSGMSACVGQNCYIDSPAKILTTCSGTCPLLRMDSSTNLFGYNGAWTTTIFRRTVSITSVSSYEAVVNVTVSWSAQGTSGTFTLSERIMDWQ